MDFLDAKIIRLLERVCQPLERKTGISNFHLAKVLAVTYCLLVLIGLAECAGWNASFKEYAFTIIVRMIQLLFLIIGCLTVVLSFIYYVLHIPEIEKEVRADAAIGRPNCLQYLPTFRSTRKLAYGYFAFVLSIGCLFIPVVPAAYHLTPILFIVSNFLLSLSLALLACNPAPPATTKSEAPLPNGEHGTATS